MHEPSALRPTLWRTCRVLANRTRLRMFGLLVQQPDQTVSAVARQLGLPLPVASQYLRAMESRGLLTARRTGGRVSYRLSAAASGSNRSLVRALRLTFQRSRDPIGPIFKLATAFTHPRRIVVFQALLAGAQSADQLQAHTGLSRWASFRHLAKLEARGFVENRAGTYAVAVRRDALGRALAALAGAPHPGSVRTLQSPRTPTGGQPAPDQASSCRRR